MEVILAQHMPRGREIQGNEEKRVMDDRLVHLTQAQDKYLSFSRSTKFEENQMLFYSFYIWNIYEPNFLHSNLLIFFICGPSLFLKYIEYKSALAVTVVIILESNTWTLPNCLFLQRCSSFLPDICTFLIWLKIRREPC